MTPTKVLFGQILLVFGIVALSLSFATQWTAASLGYQAQLGRPWTVFHGVPLYQPWLFFVWWFQFDAYAPEVFQRGAYVSASGGVLGALAAMAGSVWRARQAKLVTTYGSARWATARDLKRSGMLRPAGVFLGRADEQYLRHDGPEHVMAFAPTRSGKGVGLVIPTLLSWTGSAVIHDIKGENFAITAGWRSRFSHCLYLNPTDPRSAAYNPLLEVRRGDQEVRDVQNIADVLVDPEGALEKPLTHWEKTSHSLLVGTILHVLYAGRGQDALRRRQLPVRPGKHPFEHTLKLMMTTPHLGSARRSPGSRVVRARSAEQERERAIGRPLDRHVISRPLPRPDGGGHDLALRLAHRRPRRGRAPGIALPRRSAVRHQPHQAADPAHSQPDRPAADRELGEPGRGSRASTVSCSCSTSSRRWGGSTSSRSALAFMAGYGLRSFLIAQSLNQIEKAYGPNNSILDNCHVRIAFASNDERTAKRISDALGTATELRAQRNYAGHRLSPWLGHLMVSRQETARQLLYARRSDAASAGRRGGDGVGPPAGPREEAALLLGR